jgi:hypothetical protein
MKFQYFEAKASSQDDLLQKLKNWPKTFDYL